MRTFELRIYTLRTKEALEFYAGTIYPRHLEGSFSHFGIEAHGVWTVPADVAPRLFVLISYTEGQDVAEVGRQYMQSAEFAKDVIGFDVGNIVGVESTMLLPSPSSPLK